MGPSTPSHENHGARPDDGERASRSVLKIGAFSFATTQTVTRILWFRFSSGATSFYKGDEVINLDDQVYAQVREAIVEKLGDRAVTFVKELPIG